MGRLVLFVLMWGAVWTEEYGIGGIPQYGAGDYSDPSAGLPPLDYTGQSPDASAPLDYKYVEDSNVNPDKFSKDEVTDRWQKPKKRVSHRLGKDDVDAMEPTHFIKHRSNHHPRHRSRLKKSRSNEPQRRRRVVPGRPPEDNIDDDANQYRDEMKQEARDVVEYIHKTTTEKVVRRKPRDRRLEYSDKRSDSEEDDFVDLDRKIKDMESEKYEPELPVPRLSNVVRGRPPPPPDDNELEDETINLTPPSKASRRKPEKNYRDYNEYYDMNRVYNIKNRLPLLIRRTSTGRPVPPKNHYPRRDPPKELMDILANSRRAGIGARPDFMVRKTPPEDTADVVTSTTATEVETTSTSISTTLPVQLVTEASSSTSSTSQIFSTEDIPSLLTVAPRDLSLAEKSRLSILKKAQRKENDKPVLTTKPPILLRFTNKANTVVMVEPISANPWMRAKEVSDDSPERLEKVKRLMRHKIVSEARDISDLTDNWNDLVCEYIDTSLLESRSSEDRVNLLLLIVVSFLNTCFHVIFAQ